MTSRLGTGPLTCEARTVASSGSPELAGLHIDRAFPGSPPTEELEYGVSYNMDCSGITGWR